MKITALCAATLAIFAPLASADFSLYKVGVGGNGISGNVEGWQVYHYQTGGHVKCKDVRGWIWRSSNDVSGGKYGVRCEGTCNRSTGGNGITQLEFNAKHEASGHAPHFTFYKNRDHHIVSLHGKQIGKCTPAQGTKGSMFFCGLAAGRAEGTRKLDCKSHLTAHDINSHRP